MSGTNVTMESPKLTGFRNDNRPYEVTASAATQDVRKPDLVELKDLRARIVTDERAALPGSQAGDRRPRHQEGADEAARRTSVVTTMPAMRSSSARPSCDFKAGSVVSNEPVSVSFGNGTIEAEGLEVSDNGKVMSFKGRVRTVFAAFARAPPRTQPGTGSTAAAPRPPAPQQTSIRP